MESSILASFDGRDADGELGEVGMGIVRSASQVGRGEEMRSDG